MDAEKKAEPMLEETAADRRRVRAVQMVGDAISSVPIELPDDEFVAALVSATARDVEHLMLDGERKQLEIDGLIAENEKLRTSIAGNERMVPPEVTVAEQTQALMSILSEAHRRASTGSLRSVALFWREGREVFVRASLRGVVARPGDGRPDLVGVHGNHPWAAYFDGKETAAIRFGTIGSASVIWERKYTIGPSKVLKDLPMAIVRAQHDFDHTQMA